MRAMNLVSNLGLPVSNMATIDLANFQVVDLSAHHILSGVMSAARQIPLNENSKTLSLLVERLLRDKTIVPFGRMSATSAAI